MKTIEEVFSDNLRRLRGSRSQAAVAEMADIPLRSYQRAENGDIPHGPNRTAIANALGVQETQLFVDASNPATLSESRWLINRALDLYEKLESRIGLEVLEALASIDADQVPFLLEIIRTTRAAGEIHSTRERKKKS